MPANTNVYTGSDATLTLSPTTENAEEGKVAKTQIDAFQLSPVGRATDVEVVVHTDLELFYEIGKRHPASVRAGNIAVSGTIARASINGALLKLLLGAGAETKRVKEPYPAPAMDMMLDLKDPSKPANTSTLTVHGVKFENWNYKLPEDDFVMESVSFKGLYITVEDKAK